MEGGNLEAHAISEGTRHEERRDGGEHGLEDGEDETRDLGRKHETWT